MKFLKGTTIFVTSIMSLIFITVQYTSQFYKKFGSLSVKKIEGVYLFYWEFTISFSRSSWNFPEER